MRKMMSLIVLIAIGLGFSGCGGTYHSVSIPTKISKENVYFTAKIEPTLASMIAGYSAFNLKIQNNSNKDLEINWNKTYFIQGGQTRGTFMFEGILFIDRNNPKSPDIVFANGNYEKTIYPNNYVKFSQGSWLHYGTGLGKQGVYLTVNVDGKEIKQKIMIDIKQGKK